MKSKLNSLISQKRRKEKYIYMYLFIIDTKILKIYRVVSIIGKNIYTKD